MMTEPISPELPKDLNSPLLLNLTSERVETNLCLEMFAGLRVLGQGHFGCVLLVTFTGKGEASADYSDLEKGRNYALKVVRIPHNIKQKSIHHLKNEKKTLNLMQLSPKFVNLKATFCTRQSACLLMDYVEGLTLY
jgi:serine/threonine protein kinase